MTVEEASGDVVEIWPDNLEAVTLFVSISSQWRVGMGGPIGLDYNVLYRKLDRMKIDDARYDELENEIRVMEDAALTQMRATNK